MTTVQTRGRRGRYSAVVAGFATLALVACGSSEDSSTPATQPSVAPASSASALSTPTITASASSEESVASSEAASPSATPSPTSPAPKTSSAAPTREAAPQTLSLGAGETAHLTYFDVTFLRAARGKDGISQGWKVRVCYTSPHPGQNADGTTRVSTSPWSVLVRDGEGGQEGRWTRISEFPADKGWEPPYPTRYLRVGQCAEGWLAVKDDNPDLQYSAIRYAPADFGDQVTWSIS